jgi:4-amino-4-deoxy-L-arabinose transferase-like glycosyltransferase
MQDSSAAPTSHQPTARTFFLSKAAIFSATFATWFLIYVPGLSRPGLLDDADSIHAEASREMLLNHNWVTLYINGIRYLEKAPLMYWAVAISYKLFGVGEWQTRLPLAITVFALAWVAFIFGRRYLGEEAGFYAVLILVTAPGIYVYTRFLIPDVVVAMWLTLGLYLFLRAYEQERPSVWLCWGIAATIALNVLTKSLIGIVFPAMIIFVFLLLAGNFKKLLNMHPWTSALVFLVVSAPWHIFAAIRSPAQPTGPEKGFLWFYFVNEQFLRYLNKRIPRDYDKVPLLLFWVLLFIWLIPWFIYLFPALKEIPRRVSAWRDQLDQRSRANLFFAIWAAVIMLFFSFSTRQEYYSLPALPPLALLIGGWLQRERESPEGTPPRKAGRAASTILFALGILGFAAAMAMLAMTLPFPPGTDIGTVLTPHPGQYKLSLGHMQDLTINAFGLFRGPLLLVGLALLVGTGANWLLRRRAKLLPANLAIAAMMVVVLFCVQWGYVIFSPELTSKSMALQIKTALQPQDRIVVNGKYEIGSTLNYYTGAELYVLNGHDGNLWFGSFFPGAPDVFLDDQSFALLWNGPNRVFLFTEDYVQDQALRDLNAHTVFVFAHEGGKTIFTNRPRNR